MLKLNENKAENRVVHFNQINGLSTTRSSNEKLDKLIRNF